MRRTHKAKTMVELLAKVYKAEGWVRKAGESRSARVTALYNLTIDKERSDFIAAPLKDGEQPQDTVVNRLRKLNA